MLLTVLLCCQSLAAQELSVKSLEYIPNDAAAASYETQMQDVNGNYAGVVKVYIALDGVQFEGGGVLKQEKRGMGEYWVWMAQGSNRLKVRAPGFLPLEVSFRAYEEVNIVKSKLTYKLVITVPKGEGVQKQKLTLRYTPADAIVVIDDKIIQGINGVYENELPVGDHSYMVMSAGYGTDKGTFSLLPDTPKRLLVELEKQQTATVSTPVVQPVQPVSSPVQTTTSPSVPSSSQTTGSNRPFTVNGVSFNMVYVEGGTFTMGATSEQGKDAYKDEKPAHDVTLSSYHIGETEVTQELWQAVMGKNPSNFKGDLQRPVEKVSWKDCQKFIEKLNRMTGQQFRLPTEAQWEYAARGGSKSRGYKYSGSNDLGSVAWYTDNSGKDTHPVKTKLPNELGIYDMSGNVWELCSDYWKGSYSSGSQTNPTGPSSGSSRVLRGGSWYNNARFCRSSYRYGITPPYGNNYLGLRLSL